MLAVLSLVFAVFCGLAYMMDTIPTWNTPASIVQMLVTPSRAARRSDSRSWASPASSCRNAAKIAPGHRGRRRRHRRGGLRRAIRRPWLHSQHLGPRIRPRSRIRPDHRAVCSMRNRRGGACVALLQRRSRPHFRPPPASSSPSVSSLPVSPSTAPTWESRCSAAPRHVIGRTRRVSFGMRRKTKQGTPFEACPVSS